MATRKYADYKTAFGVALSEQLNANGLSPKALAEGIGADASVVSRLMNNKRTVTPDWVDTISQALQLSPKNTQILHRAAAIDAGYKLDLTKK
jgi:plasmid maintenance system antidote protein VapI